jgi:hypothetical protein
LIDFAAESGKRGGWHGFSRSLTRKQGGKYGALKRPNNIPQPCPNDKFPTGRANLYFSATPPTRLASRRGSPSLAFRRNVSREAFVCPQGVAVCA